MKIHTYKFKVNTVFLTPIIFRRKIFLSLMINTFILMNGEEKINCIHTKVKVHSR